MTCSNNQQPSQFVTRCLRCGCTVALEVWELGQLVDTLKKNPTNSELICACVNCGNAADRELRAAYPRGYVGKIDLEKQ